MIFNNNTSLRLRVYHHWTGSKNKAFFLLQPNGSLKPDIDYSENKDQNYNAFNVDMTFRWIFAPGSELVCAWKNAAYASHDEVDRNFWNNPSKTWLNKSNSLSVRVLYYIDYNDLRRK